MRKKNIEFTVGVFVVMGFLTLAFLIFFVSGVYFFKKGYELNAVFSVVSNLEKGAQVRLAGIPIGSVTDLEIFYEEGSNFPQVNVSMFIKDGILLRQGDRVRVEGIYGLSTPYLEIQASEEANLPVLSEGSSMKGIDPVSLEELVTRGQNIVKLLEHSIQKVSSYMDDPEINQSFRDALIYTGSLTKQLSSFIQENEPEMTSTIGKLEKALTNMEEISGRMNDGSGTVGKLISDDGLYKEMEAFVKDLKMHPWKLLRKSSSEGDRKKFLGIF